MIINTTLKKLLQISATAFFMLFGFVSMAQPEMKFEDKVQKFQKTPEGELVTFDFYFTNTGDIPLIISEIKVTCPCTKFEYPKEPVLPGNREKIYVTFDTNHKIGYQDRELEIYSNSTSSPDRIRFKGMVDNKGK